MFRTPRKYIRTNGDCFHPYGNIIISTIQPHRSIVLTACRYKAANLNSRNYYELLGVERNATPKDIKKAFFKLSKEYHPDSNSADKSLHEKFVKINEAFGILSKQTTRLTYDQSLNSPSRQPYNVNNFGHRPPTYPRPTNESFWNTPHSNKEFYDSLRRRMEQDRQRAQAHSYYYSTSHSFQNNYFAPVSIILIVIGFGMFIHALQWRIMQYSDPQYAVDPRVRHYRAYREWQRVSALRDAEYMAAIREESSSSSIEQDQEDLD